jgi:hypothetical protein
VVCWRTLTVSSTGVAEGNNAACRRRLGSRQHSGKPPTICATATPTIQAATRQGDGRRGLGDAEQMSGMHKEQGSVLGRRRLGCKAIRGLGRRSSQGGRRRIGW